LFANIKEKGFRISRPLYTNDGKFITPEGWSAWTFLEGNHIYNNHIPESINAIISFHESIKDIPKPGFLDEDNSPYAKADKYSWGEIPTSIEDQVRDLVELLYSVRKPVVGLQNQLIHGDLNPDNILLAPKQLPAIIDIAPYWRPPEFALAIYAYWIAAYTNNPPLLKYFSGINEFNQMLVRAGIRMLLIMSEFHKIHELERYRKATKIIYDLVRNNEN
jgi:hypothetical protein